MIFLAKLITLLTTSWITMYTYFLHISLVTSLSTTDLTPNFSESIYIYPTTSGISYVAIAIIVLLF